jgi:hypothetical protein
MCGLQFICCINAPKSNPDVVIDAGGLEQVVQVGLRSAVARLQEAACCFLYCLSIVGEPYVARTRAIISSGAVPVLCQLLDKGKTTSIKEVAAQLLDLIEEDVRGSTLPALAAAKAAKPLTQLLASLRTGVLVNVASLLHKLLRTYPTETLPLAAKAGAVRHLVVLLETIQQDARHPVYCCVAHMARDEQCSRALAAAGAVPKLVAAMGDAGTPSELLQPAATALRIMAHSGMHAQLRQAGAVRALVAALRRYKCTVGSAGAARAQEARTTAAAVEASEPSAAISTMPSSAAPECLLALAQLACTRGGPQQQAAAALQAIVSAGGLAQIVRLMGAVDTDMALGGVRSVACLLQENPASVKPLAEAGAIEALAALLPGSQATPVPAAAALALNAIRSASPSYRPQLGQAVCSRPGWDMVLAGRLAGRLSYPAVPAFASPIGQIRLLQESAMHMLLAAASCTQQGGSLAMQAACEALPALVQLLPISPGVASWLLYLALSKLPQHLAAAVEAGAVPALLQLLQQCSKQEVSATAGQVLWRLAGLRSGAEALVSAGGVRVLSSVLQQHLQRRQQGRQQQQPWQQQRQPRQHTKVMLLRAGCMGFTSTCCACCMSWRYMRSTQPRCRQRCSPWHLSWRICWPSCWRGSRLALLKHSRASWRWCWRWCSRLLLCWRLRVQAWNLQWQLLRPSCAFNVQK